MVKVNNRKKKKTSSQLKIEKLRKEMKKVKKLLEKSAAAQPNTDHSTAQTEFLETEVEQTKRDLMLAAIQSLRL